MAEIASAFVTIAPSAKGFGSKLNSEVGSSVKSSGTSLGKTFGKLFAAGAGLLAAAGIGSLLKGSIDEAREAQKVGAQTTAVLKSTGGAANVSAKQIGNLATALSNKIGVDDEAIQAGENLLLTFTNVRNEAGKGNDVFTQATRTVQDMAAAFGGDATSNSKILGKALNDPIKGVSALTRVGVSFTDAQKEQIKTLVESGHTLDAQKIILRELGKETKGSAEAQVTASDKASVALGNLKETIGTALLPVVDRLATFFTTKVAPAVTDFVTGIQDGTGAGGQFRDTLERIGSTIKGVLGFFNGLPEPVKKFGLEAAVAVAVVPKLASAVSNLGNQIAITGDKMAIAGEKSLLLKRGLGAAAGIGGMIAITEGARTGNKAVSLLGASLTGAFVGGSLGSAIPVVGTAVGAVAGAAVGAGIGLFRMKKAADAASASATAAKPNFDELGAAIANIDDANRRAVKSSILLKLQQDGVVSSAGQLGIATSDLIKASLGNKKAIDRVNNAWTSQGDILDGLQNQKVSEWLAGLRRATMLSEEETRKNNAALDGTDRKTRKANAALNTVGKIGPQTDKWSALLIGDLNQATNRTHSYADDIRTTIATQPGKARSNLSNFRNDLIGRLNGIKGDAKTAGTGIGTSIKSGVQGGLSGLASAAAAAVHAAVAAAQAAVGGGGGGGKGGGGKAGGRGKTTAEGVGRQVGERLAIGLERSAPLLEKTAEKVGKKLKEKLAKIRDSLAGVRADFASLVEPIASNFTQGLFDFDTAGAFTANLATVKGTLQTLLANFAKLKGEGLSPGFLYQLFQSGGPALINGLAGLDAAGAQSAGALFGDVMSLSDQLGTAVAGSTDKGAALENQTVRLEKKLDRLIQAVKDGDGGKGHADRAAARARRRAVHA